MKRYLEMLGFLRETTSVVTSLTNNEVTGMKRVIVKTNNKNEVTKVMMASRPSDYESDIPMPELPAFHRIDPTEVEFTPELAKGVLEHLNHANRDMRQSKVKVFAERMEKEEWLFGSAHSLHFDETGQLTTGQHRLAAVIMSGLAQPFICFQSSAEDIRYFDEESHSKADKLQMQMNVSREQANVALASRKFSGIIADYAGCSNRDERNALMLKLATQRVAISDEEAKDVVLSTARAYDLFKHHEPSTKEKSVPSRVYLSSVVVAITKELLDTGHEEAAEAFNTFIWGTECPAIREDEQSLFYAAMYAFAPKNHLQRPGTYYKDATSYKAARMAMIMADLAGRILRGPLGEDTDATPFNNRLSFPIK